MAKGPTPEQQADYLVRKLEQTIRDNRTAKGMSFATWQAIAREEITNALRSADKRRAGDDRLLSRMALVVASGLVTVGFWSAVVLVDKSFGRVAAMLSLAAGACIAFVLGEWALKRAGRRWADEKRAERLAKIEDIDRRIKRMEFEMQKKADRLKEKMEAAE